MKNKDNFFKLLFAVKAIEVVFVVEAK